MEIKRNAKKQSVSHKPAAINLKVRKSRRNRGIQSQTLGLAKSIGLGSRLEASLNSASYENRPSLTFDRPSINSRVENKKSYFAHTKNIHYAMRDEARGSYADTNETMLSNLTQRDFEARKIHDEKTNPWSRVIMSGLLTGFNFFIFCNIVSAIIFRGHLAAYAIPGIGLHTFSNFIAGMMSSHFSACKTIMAGVDINPALLFSQCIVIINSHTHDDQSFFPTSLLVIATGSALVGFSCLILGYFRMTKVVKFIPKNVSYGFLAAVGWSIIGKGITLTTDADPAILAFSTADGWKRATPAIFVGVPLYILRERYDVNPLIVLPIFLVCPVLLFWLIIWAQEDYGVSQARQDLWLFPETNQTMFWKSWESLYLNPDINWVAYRDCWVQLSMLVIIVLMDFLLHLEKIEDIYDMDLDFDEEFVFNGWANFINVFSLSAPSYAQARYNLINMEISKSAFDRRPIIICAVLNLILFLLPFSIFDILPRFYTGGIILYAGMYFVWSNMVTPYKLMSRMEYFTVLIIVLVDWIDTLVSALLVGVFLAALFFGYEYSKSYKFFDFDGKEYHSTIQRPIIHRMKLEQFGHMLMVVIIKEALFFGSAVQIQNKIHDKFFQQQNLPSWRKLKYLILDFEYITVVDSSAYAVLKTIYREMETHNVTLLWSGFTKKFKKKMSKRMNMKFIDETNLFEDYDHAVEYVEERLLIYAEKIRSKWLILPSMKKLNALASVKAVQGPLATLLSKHSPIWDYCRAKDYEKGYTLIKAGEWSKRLIILQSGKVSFYIPHENKRKRVNCMTIGTILLEGLPSQETIIVDKKSTFIIFDKKDLDKLSEEKPNLAHRLKKDVANDVFTTRNVLGQAFEQPTHFSHWNKYFDLMKTLEDEKKHEPKVSKVFEESAQHVINRNSGQLSSHVHIKANSTVDEMAQKFFNRLKTQDRNSSRNRMASENILRIHSKGIPEKHIFHIMINKMSIRDVAGWFETLNLNEAAVYCRTKNIDGKALAKFGEIDFQAMGLSKNNRIKYKKFLGELKSLKEEGYIKHVITVEEKQESQEEIRKIKLTVQNFQKNTYKIQYTLSRSQILEYTDHFEAHAITKHGTDVLPTQSIRHVLLDLGYYETRGEMLDLLEFEKIDPEEGVNLAHFLHLMCKVTMKDLSIKETRRYAEAFSKYDINKSGTLNSGQVDKFINDAFGFHLSEYHEQELIEEWESTKKGELGFSEFMSMIAYSLKSKELEYSIIRAFYLFSLKTHKNRHLITYEDVMAMVTREIGNIENPITELEAKEMVWEANLDSVGKQRESFGTLEKKEDTVTLSNFVTMITTMYDPGWIVHFHWPKREVHRFMHDLIEAHEFDSLDEVEVIDEVKQGEEVEIELAKETPRQNRNSTVDQVRYHTEKKVKVNQHYSA